MAGINACESVALSNDVHLYDLAETITAPEHYQALALDLLGSQSAVANNIGKTTVNYEDVVYRCLLEWRNEYGSGDGQCRELTEILRECGLSAAADAVESKMEQRRRCLADDRVLYDITAHMNCTKHYSNLGLRLGLTQARIANIIGRIHPHYTDALFKAFVSWRDRYGSSLQHAKELRRILVKRKLSLAVEFLDSVDSDLADDDTNADSSPDESSPVFDFVLESKDDLLEDSTEDTTPSYSIQEEENQLEPIQQEEPQPLRVPEPEAALHRISPEGCSCSR